MNQYQDYSLEDFVLDARFQGWVRHQQPAEAGFWQEYMDANPLQDDDIRQARKLLDSVYRHYATDIDDAEVDIEIQALLHRVRAQRADRGESKQVHDIASPTRRLGSYGWIARIAAGIVVAIGLGWLGMNLWCSDCSYNGLVSGKQLIEKTNTSDKQQIIRLADGSQVVLYPQSRLSYAADFKADQRNVYLSGDAYFQVAKDAKRPFLVHTANLVTKVLGTSFMVRARDASDKTLVEVREGKVSVFKQREFQSQSASPNGMVLTPNQKLIFEHASKDMRRTLSDNPEIVPSDHPKSFEFVNAPASTVLTDIEEAYQIDIIFDRDVLDSCPVKASLAGQSMFNKLGILCEIIEARYEVLDGKIVVYSKGCKS